MTRVARDAPSAVGRAPSGLGLVVFGLVTASCWIVAAALAFLINQPENVLTTKWQKSVKTAVQTVLPEQWGFFTRSPREDELLPYRLTSGEWETASLYPHSQPQHVFGWDRVSRAQGIEIGILYKEVAEEKWHRCPAGSTVAACLKAAPTDLEWVKTRNPSPAPTLCGRAAVAKALPPPWAWANIGQAKQRWSIVLLDISC